MARDREFFFVGRRRCNGLSMDASCVRIQKRVACAGEGA
jgi:hypothetical protein